MNHHGFLIGLSEPNSSNPSFPVETLESQWTDNAIIIPMSLLGHKDAATSEAFRSE